MIRGGGVALGLVLAATTAASQVPQGVVVSHVAPGGEADRAGVRAGDVVLRWSRDEGMGSPAAGALASPIDLEDIQIEQRPRGAVRLVVARAHEQTEIALGAGKWGLEARPRVRTRDAHELVEALGLGGPAAAARLQRLAVSEPHPGVRAWLLVRAAETLHAGPDDALWRAAVDAAEGNTVIRGWVHQRQGSAFEAASRFSEAARAYSRDLRCRPADSLSAARSLNALGILGIVQGDPDAAEWFLRRALEIRKRSDRRDFDVAVSLGNLGTVAWGRGDLELAERCFRRLMGIFAQLVPDSLILATCMNNLALVVTDRGDPEAAEPLHRRALEIRQRLAPGSLDVAASLSNLGRVAGNRGNIEASEDFYRQALEIEQRIAPGSLPVARTYTNLGVNAFDRGDFEIAEEHQRRAIDIYQRLAPGSTDLAMSLNNLATVAWSRGDLETAEDCLSSALNVFEETNPESLAVAASLGNLGLVAASRRDHEAAEDYHRRALEIKERLVPQGLGVASSLNSLGLLARERGDTVKARKLHERSLEIRERLAPGTLYLAESLNSLGLVALDRGDREAAADYFRKTQSILERVAPLSLGIAANLANLGVLAAAADDVEAAERHYRDALAILSQLAPNSADAAEIHYLLGSLFRAAGRHEDASEELARAVEALEGQGTMLGGSDEAKTRFRSGRHRYYRDYVDLLLELGRSADAFLVLERSRARSLLKMLTERDLVFHNDLPDELDRQRRLTNVAYERTQAQLNRLSPVNDVEGVEALLAQLEQVRRQQDEIRAEIRRQSPGLAALQYPEPLVLEAAQSALDAGTVLLAYSLGQEASHLFIVEPEEGPQVTALIAGEEALRDQVGHFRRLIEASRGTPSAVVTEALEQKAADLYQALIAPSEARIGAAERIVIMPDGPLNALPFAALIMDGQTGTSHHLIEQLPVHSVVSMTVYAELRRRRAESWKGPALVALGDPLYPYEPEDRGADNTPVSAVHERSRTLRPLPATRDEVLGIAALYGDRTRTHLGADATEERAKAVGKGIRYLHLAAHGLVDERFPLNSAVALTIREDPEEGQENGLLQAWEVFESVRIDADMVVLSACDTALGKEVAGEGMIGLTRAFQYAGTPTVLASLWRVADQPTAVLMKRFYSGLKDGLPKDEALRQAQLTFINEPVVIGEGDDTVERDLSHPFYWAAFQLYGDWR